MSLRRCLLVAALALFSPRPSPGQSVDLSADQARAILHKHCASCHAGAGARAGRRLLEPGQLNDLVTPGDPEASELLQLVEVGSEPRGARAKVTAGEVEVLRDWIKTGAKPFTDVKTDEYALRQILLDQRAALGGAGDRYFAFNHLLDNERSDPALFAAALTKALNLLSWKPDVVRPVPIDPLGTVFRVRLADLGWDVKPYETAPKEFKMARYRDFNLFDLVLLEYPYAALPRNSPAFDAVDRAYLQKAAPVRPVPFVRGDWFVTAAGRPPLYADLLRLPATLHGLEKKLGVTAERARSGLYLNDSKEVRVPRLVERRGDRSNPFWRTYDLSSAKTDSDVLSSADTTEAGGAALFALRNGLPGFLTAMPEGSRFDGARTDGPPRDVWKDGKPPLTGFDCLRCHGAGVVAPAADRVAAALLDRETVLSSEKKEALRKLYPGGTVVKDAAEGDRKRFAAALAEVTPSPDPLAEVARRFRPPEPAADADPIPPLDGIASTTHDGGAKVELTFFKGKAVMGKVDKSDEPKETKSLVFKPGDRWYFTVANKTGNNVWVEIIGTDRVGLLDTFQTPMMLAPTRVLRFPADPVPGYDIPAKEPVGRSTITLFVSSASFQSGARLSLGDAKALDYVTDRFVHGFVDRDSDKKLRIDWSTDPRKMSKQTVEIEIQK
jgi:hypothetical protein